MSNFLESLFRNQSAIYKYFLYVASIFVIVFFFPKGGKFKYEFQKGKPWQYENLYAPFDFPIKKTEAELAAEEKSIRERQLPYYRFDADIAQKVKSGFDSLFEASFSDQNFSQSRKKVIYQASKEVMDDVFTYGILGRTERTDFLGDVFLVRNSKARRVKADDFFELREVEQKVGQVVLRYDLKDFQFALNNLFFETLQPNVFYDKSLTDKAVLDALAKLSTTRGTVDEGKLIIARGEVVEADNFKVLNSLKDEYESELWTAQNQYFIIAGYTVLVALVLIMLLFFLKRYRPVVFANNTKVTFIFFNILLMVIATIMTVKFNEKLVFVVPLCILPLILKTFFDARLALFAHVLTVLILGFVVPNSFGFIFLQIMAGIVAVLTVSELYKRANLFISVGQITLMYIVAYLAFHSIHEASFRNIEWYVLGLFFLNGMITLFVQPLIYIYEKLFGLVSDVSLLELSDTNSKLLKELSNKASGTFHHSLQVANLAEAAANEIGANALLVRVGALYHDIGKMENPTYFTENQITNLNPHDEIAPVQSAKIIIDHVIKGIELAKKNNLPDRVIDFIRTNHGNTLVYSFYKKEEEQNPSVDPAQFTYPGPLPFSKETAILMMADSVEAASKSLKDPTFPVIDEFVNKIVAGLITGKQFF
ncbi:MAG: HD family phosphohydrolase [Flavobacteriaceae bacterium]